MNFDKLYKVAAFFSKQAQTVEESSDEGPFDFEKHLQEENRKYYEEEAKHADVSDEILIKKIQTLVTFISQHQSIKISILPAIDAWTGERDSDPNRVKIYIDFTGPKSLKHITRKYGSGQEFSGTKRMAMLETLMHLRKVAFDI